MIFRRHPRWLPKRFAPRLLPSYPQNSSHPLPLTLSWRLLTRLTPLECAVTSKHRVLPGFGRNCPRVTSLECAVTQINAVTPLECALTKKLGGRGMSFRFSNLDFRGSTFARGRGVRTLPSFPASRRSR